MVCITGDVVEPLQACRWLIYLFSPRSSHLHCMYYILHRCSLGHISSHSQALYFRIQCHATIKFHPCPPIVHWCVYNFLLPLSDSMQCIPYIFYYGPYLHTFILVRDPALPIWLHTMGKCHCIKNREESSWIDSYCPSPHRLKIKQESIFFDFLFFCICTHQTWAHCQYSYHFSIINDSPILTFCHYASSFKHTFF
jgi:hypothetical protein